MPSARDPEVIYRLFGQRLREARERKRLPQQELATLSGLTRASIANIESGRQRVMLHQLVHFADALQVDVGEIVPKTSEIPTDLRSAATDSMARYLEQISEMYLSRVSDRMRDEESEPQ